MEGLIELGATLCTKTKPKCSSCPLRHQCEGFSLGTSETLPIKEKKTATIKIRRTVILVQSGEYVLVRRVPKGEVMEGLSEFPYDDEQTDPKKILNTPLKAVTSCPTEKHTYTKYNVTLYPYLMESANCPVLNGYTWVERAKLHTLAFSAGHRRLLINILA
jgi:A/G-specific adenine glycosylase